MLLQQQGLFDGYALGSGNHPALTANELLYLGMNTEIGDIESAVDASSRPNYNNMTAEEFRMYVIKHTHCSALVKITADFSEIFFSHDTWSQYETMLRLYKSFLTVTPSGESAANALADIHYSGYPGQIASIDDYYITSQKLAIMETTNDIFNDTLWDALSPNTIPYFIRVTVATRLATDAK